MTKDEASLTIYDISLVVDAVSMVMDEASLVMEMAGLNRFLGIWIKNCRFWVI